MADPSQPNPFKLQMDAEKKAGRGQAMLHQKLAAKEQEIRQVSDKLRAADRQIKNLTTQLSEQKQLYREVSGKLEELKEQRATSVQRTESEAIPQAKTENNAVPAAAPDLARPSMDTAALLNQHDALAVKLLEGGLENLDGATLAAAAAGLRDTGVLESQLSRARAENERLQKEIQHLNDTVFSKTFKAPSAWADREVKYKMEKRTWELEAQGLKEKLKGLQEENDAYRAANRAAEFEETVKGLKAEIQKQIDEKVAAQQALHELQLEMRELNVKAANAAKQSHSRQESIVSSRVSLMEDQSLEPISPARFPSKANGLAHHSRTSSAETIGPNAQDSLQRLDEQRLITRSPSRARKSLLSTPQKRDVPTPDARASDPPAPVGNSDIDVDLLKDEFDSRAKNQDSEYKPSTAAQSQIDDGGAAERAARAQHRETKSVKQQNDMSADVSHDDKQNEVAAAEGSVNAAVLAHAEGAPLGAPAAQQRPEGAAQAAADVRHSDSQADSHAAPGSVMGAVLAHPEDPESSGASGSKSGQPEERNASADVRHSDTQEDVRAAPGSVKDAVLALPEDSEASPIGSRVTAQGHANDGPADVRHTDSQADVQAASGTVLEAVLAHPEGSGAATQSESQSGLAEARNAGSADVRYSDNQENLQAASGTVMGAVLAHPEGGNVEPTAARSGRLQPGVAAPADVKSSDATADFRATPGTVAEAVLRSPEDAEGVAPDSSEIEPQKSAQARVSESQTKTPDAGGKSTKKGELGGRSDLDSARLLNTKNLRVSENASRESGNDSTGGLISNGEAAERDESTQQAEPGPKKTAVNQLESTSEDTSETQRTADFASPRPGQPVKAKITTSEIQPDESVPLQGAEKVQAQDKNSRGVLKEDGHITTATQMDHITPPGSPFAYRGSDNVTSQQGLQEDLKAGYGSNPFAKARDTQTGQGASPTGRSPDARPVDGQSLKPTPDGNAPGDVASRRMGTVRRRSEPDLGHLQLTPQTSVSGRLNLDVTGRGSTDSEQARNRALLSQASRQADDTLILKASGESGSPWTEEKRQALEAQKAATEAGLQEHLVDQDLATLRRRTVEMATRIETHDAQIQKMQLALELADQEKAKLEEDLQVAMQAANRRGVSDEEDLDAIRGRMRNAAQQNEIRSKDLEVALQDSHRENARLEQVAYELQKQLTNIASKLSSGSLPDKKELQLEPLREDDEAGIALDPIAKQLARRRSSRTGGLASHASNFASMIGGLTDEELEVMNLREENAKMMETLVETKVQLAETEGDYLKMKRALIRSVEREVAHSELLDSLRTARDSNDTSEMMKLLESYKKPLKRVAGDVASLGERTRY